MEYIERIGYKNNTGVKARLESMEYYPFHLHRNDLEIVCVLNGKVSISDSAASYSLSYGDVHIFNRNDPHKIWSDDSENIILTIQISCDYYKQYFKELDTAYFISDTYSQRDMYSTDIKYLRFQLARLYYACAKTKSSGQLCLEEYARDLLSLLINQYQQYVYKVDDDGPANIIRLQNIQHIYKNYERMYRIVDLVSDHFAEKITLEAIAASEYLSTSHLSRYIKDTLGLSFSQLVSLTRCEEAARLLSGTKKTVDQIASEVGFSNRKHLALQFKRWYGMTPSCYRNDILKDLSSDSKVRLRPFDYEFAKIILEMYLDE